MKKILTGSREFFNTDTSDTDYIIFQDQEKVFEYKKDNGECNFCYRKDLKKEDYYYWYNNENRWALNFGSLITKEFLEHLKIDIFCADYQIIFEFIKKPFVRAYRYMFEASKKYLYRFYIYSRFIQNQSFNLSEEEKAKALLIKSGYFPSKEELIALYDFFGQKEYAIYLLEHEIAKIQSVKQTDWLNEAW